MTGGLEDVHRVPQTDRGITFRVLDAVPGGRRRQLDALRMSRRLARQRRAVRIGKLPREGRSHSPTAVHRALR
jgi:hypothetical protein